MWLLYFILFLFLLRYLLFLPASLTETKGETKVNCAAAIAMAILHCGGKLAFQFGMGPRSTPASEGISTPKPFRRNSWSCGSEGSFHYLTRKRRCLVPEAVDSAAHRALVCLYKSWGFSSQRRKTRRTVPWQGVSNSYYTHDDTTSRVSLAQASCIVYIYDKVGKGIKIGAGMMILGILYVGADI